MGKPVPFKLDYASARGAAIHMHSTDDAVSAVESQSMGSAKMLLAIFLAIGLIICVSLPLAANVIFRRGLNALSFFGSGCLIVVLVYLLLVIAHRWRDPAEFLEMNRKTVLIRRAIDFGDVRIAIEDLHGFDCRKIKAKTRYGPQMIFAVCVITRSGPTHTVFAGHDEQLLEKVVGVFRTFLTTIRPSPMAEAIIPPRPSL